MEMMNNTTATFETSKTEKYSVSAIVKKMDNFTIRFDHAAQRESEQWNSKMKSNLISDILQGNPIPALVLAEQIIGGMSITWNLDGKQRCTNVYSYIHDGFKICKGVRRNIIRYQSLVRDENGKPALVDGVPSFEWKEFDIINKKFSQLPDELQDRIMDYCFEATLFLNCSSEDITYHIARYNDGKPMNNSQKGIIRLGEEFATRVKSISKMPFFTDCGSFTYKEDRNGTIDRVVVESVMATNFSDDWKKNQEDMCEYIYSNATDEMFDELEDTIERLTDIVEEDADELFNSKDAFIWFTVFNRNKNKISDEKFGEFLIKFATELCNVEVDGITFTALKENRSTKDKSVVLKKVNHIETLLKSFCTGK